jgi:hypothetical protein
MNKFYIVVLASLMLASSAAYATPAACVSETLDNYVTPPSFSCSINALTFGSWTYASATIPASSILVTPITTLGDEGFSFNTLWSVNNTNSPGTTMSEDSTIGYTATGAGINDLQLSFNGGNITGIGSASVTETYCFGNPVASCPSGSGGQIGVTNPPPSFTDVVFFSPQTSISVIKDIGVTTGVCPATNPRCTGSATISQVTNQFSSPEPLSFVLLGSGLLGLGLLRKRIKR